MCDEENMVAMALEINGLGRISKSDSEHPPNSHSGPMCSEGSMSLIRRASCPFCDRGPPNLNILDSYTNNQRALAIAA